MWVLTEQFPDRLSAYSFDELNIVGFYADKSLVTKAIRELFKEVGCSIGDEENKKLKNWGRAKAPKQLSLYFHYGDIECCIRATFNTNKEN